MPDNAVSCPKTAQLSSIFELLGASSCWAHGYANSGSNRPSNLSTKKKILKIEILLTVEVRTDCVQRWTLNSATRDPFEARQGVTRDPRPLNLPGAGATLQHQHKKCSTSRKHQQPTGSIRGAGNLGSSTRWRRQTL